MHLLHRLGSFFGVDAGAAEKKKLLRAVPVGGVDEVVLDTQIFKQELRGQSAVGFNAAHARGGDENVLGRFCLKKFLHGGGVQQIQFRVGTPDKICVSGGLQRAPDGATRKAAMAGHVNAGVGGQLRWASMAVCILGKCWAGLRLSNAARILASLLMRKLTRRARARLGMRTP